MISVIIPTLNEEKRLGGLLESLKKQDFAGQYEIIVADGNSEDQTREIARQYTDKIIIGQIRSAAAERQKGAEIAQGDILLFIDADCVANPNLLNEINKTFSDKNTVLAGGSLWPLEKNKLIWFSCLFWGLAVRLSILFKRPLISGQCLAIRKNIFQQIGGFQVNQQTGEDTLLAIEAIKLGKYKYNPRTKIYFSTRRIRKMGLIKYYLFHIKNYFSTHLFKKTQEHYEVIRD